MSLVLVRVHHHEIVYQVVLFSSSFSTSVFLPLCWNTIAVVTCVCTNAEWSEYHSLTVFSRHNVPYMLSERGRFVWNIFLLCVSGVQSGRCRYLHPESSFLSPDSVFVYLNGCVCILEHTELVFGMLTFCSFCHRAVVEVCVFEESCDFTENDKKWETTFPKSLDWGWLLIFPSE